MLASDINDHDIGHTLVTGRNSKRKRFTIVDVHQYGSYAAVTATDAHSSTKTVILPHAEEIEIEP